MENIEQLARNKVQAKIYAISLERSMLHNQLAQGITDVTIEESYTIIDKLSGEVKLYEHILNKLEK